MKIELLIAMHSIFCRNS